MSPHAVFQLPNSVVSLSDAAASDSSSCCDGAKIPFAQSCNLVGQLCFQWIVVGSVVPGSYQSGNRLLKPWEIAVVGGGDEGIEGEIFGVMQNPDRVQSTGGLASCFYVGWIVFPFWATRPGGGPWPVVRVVEPAAFRVQKMWRLIDGKKSLPFGCGVTSVHRLGPVEAGIPPWNEVAVEIGDVAVGVGEDGVVRRVCLKLHRLSVGLVIFCLCACIRLGELLYR